MLLLLLSSEYKQDLEEVIRDETNGEFTDALLAMLQADKDEDIDINLELAKKDAKVQDRERFCIITRCNVFSPTENVTNGWAGGSFYFKQRGSVFSF